MILRVFPRRTALTPTDDYVFVGEPPMIRPDASEVHISCAFTWDKPQAEHLAKAWGQYYPIVKLGGPAYDSPCGEFVPGRYVKTGVTFTSRGCDNKCPWCLVPKREGKLSYLPIQVGNIINDNNFLQCRKEHRDKVFAMLRTQRHIEFTGGLDCREMTQGIADDLLSLRIYHMFFACDSKGSLKQLQRVGKMFPGVDRRKLRCYVLLAFGGQTISQAIEQLENVWQAGFMPHSQLFQPDDKLIDYSPEWRHLARRWSRPVCMQVMKGRDRTL